MPVDKITIFKIKPTAKDFSDFVRAKQPKVIPVTAPAGATFSVEAVAAFKEHKSEPKTHINIPWLVFLNDGLQPQDRFPFKSENRFPSAVVALKFTEGGKDEFYAIVFGLAGESHLDSEYIVRDFGIRVAMNICDQDLLKRVQSTRHAEVSTQSERQISAGSAFSVFDIDDEKEFLQAIAGAARKDFGFIQSFTGKESIAIKSSKDKSIKWDNLIERVHKLASAYLLTNFETAFPGYAKFHFETDTGIIDALDGQLYQSIIGGNLNAIHLAPPEVVDYANCDFSYGDGEARFEDLTLDQLLQSRKAFRAGTGISAIKSMRVWLWNVETNQRLRPWNAYRCLVAEGHYGGQTYILSNGQWKKVSKVLQQEIDDYMPTIPVAACAYLPHDINIWDAKVQKNRESVFNERAKDGNPALLLLDKEKLKIGGKRLYEVCDLLHTNRELIQVKRFQSSSSSVSHLFLQGRFYGQAFLTDEATRVSMRAAIQAHLAAPEDEPFLRIVPAKREFNPHDYTVVFCMLAEQDITLKDLPFMARYELMHSHRFICDTLGMQCAVVFRRIQVVNRPAPMPAKKAGRNGGIAGAIP